MAETSFPVAGGTGVTDAAYERLMAPLMGAGRYGPNPTAAHVNTPLIYADSTGRQVKAYANQSAIVRGFRWESGTTPPVVALDANTSGNPRVDLITVRLDRTTFQVRLAKINGTPGATPAPPEPIQDTGSTGVWDLPVARVRVVSSATTGQPTIAAGDVTPVDYWLAPPSFMARNATTMPLPSPGAFAHRLDTDRLYRGSGTSWVQLGERGSFTKLAAASNTWTSDNIYARRVNGFVYFQCQVILNIADRPAGTDMTVCTLPTQFRPDNHNISVAGWMSPNQVCSLNIDGTSGVVQLRNYPSVFPNGGYLVIHPTTWPARD